FAREELSPADFADLRKCFLLNDVSNFTESLKSKESKQNFEFREPSYYGKDELEEGLIDTETLFLYLSDFVWDYRAERRMYPGISGENELLRRMMETISNGDEPQISGFPRAYLEFEMHLRNLVTALSHRAENQSFSDQIIPFDFFSERIAASQAADFGLGGDLGVLSGLIDLYEGTSPLVIEQTITAVRWSWLDEMVDYNLFSREAVFAYGVKIADVERWLAISPEAGRQKLDELLEQLHQNIKKMTREENSE
ncbi:MAG: DUF2764 family protein, partial [Spirochaetaceae bacterium]|nr:DUF2764 family protein [Spirochaetaceae bacterium]